MIIGRDPKDPEFLRRFKQIQSDATAKARDRQRRARLAKKADGICIICGSSLWYDEDYKSDWLKRLRRRRYYGNRSIPNEQPVIVIGHGSSIQFWAQTYMPIKEACRSANDERNLFLIHSACNAKQGSADMEEFIEDPSASKVARPSSGMCARGLHEMTGDNIFIILGGRKRRCKACYELKRR